MERASAKDEHFLRRCLELAAKGEGYTSPNPMVGCVIVKNGSVVGEGYHKRFGGPHAEVEALRRAGRMARGTTLYVNLEPCPHHGKTPPCTDAIIRAGIKKVVTSSADPNPLVGGRGIEKLRASGITVEVGAIRLEAEALNEKFFTFMRTRLPFVGIKIAQTLDGRVADRLGVSKWITSRAARTEAHRIRSLYDAVLVGANTVAKDDPQLTVRYARGRNPVRVVLDPRLRLKTTARVFDTKRAPTLVFTSARSMSRHRRVVAKLVMQGTCVLGMEKGRIFDLRLLLQALAALGISSVLVEGGPATIGQFVEQKLAKRLHWFVAPKIVGGGLQSLSLGAPYRLSRSPLVRNMIVRMTGPDLLVEGSLWYQ